MSKPVAKETDNKASAFAFHGLDISPESLPKTGHAKADCPLCGKEKHFYLRLDGEKAGAWDCKVCGESGNIYTFLHQIYHHCLQHTSESQRAKLAKHRNERARAVGPGVPASAYEECAWNPMTERWLIPIRNQEGSLANLLAYDPAADKPYACPTPGLTVHPYGSHHVGPKSVEHYDEILVCEGPWDAIALAWLVSRIPASRDDTRYAVTGLCGATNFPPLFAKALDGKRVLFLFDADEAGEKGLEKAIGSLREHAPAAKPSGVVWPESSPKGHDVSAFLCASQDKPWVTWRSLTDLVASIPLGVTTNITVHDEPLPDIQRTTFPQVLKDFKDTGIQLNEQLERGIALAMTTILTRQLPSDPLWLFLVGPSGSGKSLILESLTADSDRVVYSTTLTSKSLLSGYAIGNEDPSILARVMSGSRTLVVKDYTTVLTQPPQEQQELNGLLRDAYDGSVQRFWGNGVCRAYEGFFPVLAGVTPEIHANASSHLGERFLKYEISGPTPLQSTKMILAAMKSGEDPHTDLRGRRTRQASVASYLAYLEAKDRKQHPLKESHQKTIASLAQLIAVCRSVVRRDELGALRYEASIESATRSSKQLVKAAQTLPIVLGKRGIDNETIDIVRAVAWDSAYGKQRNTLASLWENGPMLIEELAADLATPPKSTWNTVRDLCDLRVLSRKRAPTNGRQGQPAYLYQLSSTVQKLAETSKFFG